MGRMTFRDGQRVERHEVEPALCEAYPNLPHFKASITEQEKSDKGHVHVTVRITGPNGEPLVANGKPIAYYSTRPMIGLPQIAQVDWVA
jgi:hypothetical protein